MALFLVGFNIDKHRASYQSETGKLIQLMRGIYIDAQDDIEATVLRHGIRIVQYLYPRAYLSGLSSFLLSPTSEGKLFISGTRSQRTRIRNLEIIQNKGPEIAPSLSEASIKDDLGEFKINVSSVRQRFLEAFRRRSEHSAAIDAAIRITLSNRLIEEYGSADKASDALWVLARKNEWYHEGEQAERYLKKETHLTYTVGNLAEFELTVAWHKQIIGTLSHDGFEWYWKSSPNGQLPLIRQTIPGKLPPFISALLPEGWLEGVLKNQDERAALKSGKRYMSNITIVENVAELSKLPSDILTTTLKEYSLDGVFTGTYAGPEKNDLESSFEINLAQLFKSSATPRLSGVQIKAPMFLDSNGFLQTSEKLPFTHILKPAGTSGFQYLPLVEWTCMDIAKKVGFETPDFALVRMPNEMPPSLIVERFDIRRSQSDIQLIAMEDFCSLLDIPSSEKYNGTIERAAHALRAVSTSPLDDLSTLFKRALFAWLIGDGDMHLKNLAVLKTAFPNQNRFHTVRMAPVYDAVSTGVFPQIDNKLAIKMNGKDNRIKRTDFLKLASIIGITKTDAEFMISSLSTLLKAAIQYSKLPKGIHYSNSETKIVDKVKEICNNRLNEFERNN